MSYQPKKPFFKMSIPELQAYVNRCKRIDRKKYNQHKKVGGKKSRSKRLRKTRKKRQKHTRKKKKT